MSTIENVIKNGLFSVSDESYFTWRGCDCCDDGLGCDVYSVEGYEDLEHARDSENLVTFSICGECLNRLYYGNGGKQNGKDNAD